MTVRIALCLAAIAALAALTGAMERCGTLSDCLAAPGTWHPATDRQPPEPLDLSPEDALRTDMILTAMLAN